MMLKLGDSHFKKNPSTHSRIWHVDFIETNKVVTGERTYTFRKKKRQGVLFYSFLPFW